MILEAQDRITLNDLIEILTRISNKFGGDIGSNELIALSINQYEVHVQLEDVGEFSFQFENETVYSVQDGQ